MKQSILFVCLGNICRSCTAEEIFRTFTEKAHCSDDFYLDSAGLIDYHQGELPDARMRQAAARHGYHLTHRSRPVCPADFDRFDWIVAMDEQNRKGLSALASTDTQRSKILMMADYLTTYKDTHSYIPDPYYGTMPDFELVVTLLEDACSSLLDKTRG